MVHFSKHLICVFFIFALLTSACHNNDNLPQGNSSFNFPIGLDNKIKVAILPFSGVDPTYSKLLKSEIELFYSCEVTVLKEHTLPAFAFYQPRNRYKADSLLKYLKLSLPKDYNLIIGITGTDISTKDDIHEDWGVFGLGFMGGPSCIISDFRLKKSAIDKKHLQQRIIKVALHELGHTLGLPHCTSSNKCLMKDANGTIKSVDEEEKQLCESCKIKLASFRTIK
ncbi:MAG: Zn-dependent protease [Bacteroidetes bacterium]|nr:Zn-dependent protease [Bacteroidota bacterium]